MSGSVRPTRAEIDLDAIRQNVRLLAERAGAPACAVVKADGYGHGAVPVARAALEAGATWLAVALVEEGEELRSAGIDAPVLLLTEPPVEHVDRVLGASLTPALYSEAFGAALDAAGRQRGEPVVAHLKVDTGMGRVGVPQDQWAPFLDHLTGWKGVRAAGLWTHLARADEPEVDTTARQLEAFDEFLRMAARAGVDAEVVHAANSAGALLHPRAAYDLVRVGIAIYGLSPAPQVDAAEHGLRPAMRMVSEVSFVKRVAAGVPVSYGHTWSAPTDGWIATLPLGYADGVPRLLSNAADVLIGGRPYPLVGNVCMDQVMIWCGDDEVAVGDEVVLLGDQAAASIPADRWAAAASTITYEIATSITKRVPRVYYA